MRLTVEGLAEAIQSARNLEKLQAELRDALIERLLQNSTALPNDTLASGLSPVAG